MEISLIAAMDMDGRIGINGKMYWSIPEDLKHFRELTFHKIVVMGRKTYESIGKPLDHRTNIILSADKAFRPSPGCIVYKSIKDALLGLNRLNSFDKPQEIMIIGGASIYEQFLPYVEKMYITRIDISPPKPINGNETFFPDIDWNEWKETKDEKTQSSFGINIEFLEFIKK